ncbi:MAG: deoxyribose-phosphate aldolase [Treponema sp.]|jgi:deoxyribose-phosphate aldolase|nr:deoxyribose-phosphate aldolase [Treponema sp.]
MTDQEILACVDHTLLKATATWDEIAKLCDEAVRYKTASVCIPPCYVKRAREDFPGLAVCTVIGFPLGYSATQSKITEAETALADGASEIDMVVNIAWIKSGLFGSVEDEIRRIKKSAGDAILKVIVETCYLTEQEKIHMCEITANAGADYIKTSTGFGVAGATLEDVALFRTYTGKKVKIKAAGGIKTKEAMIALLEAGCSRIGSSSAVDLITRQP